MTAKSRVSVLLAVLLLFGLTALWSCGNSGGDDNTPDPSAVRPAITGLSRSSASVGDQVDVFGLNFGTNQSGGNVRLNGVDFVVNAWTETMLDITVAQGMVSGIVVVTVGNMSSQSGPEAQLFIPAEPAGRPLINALIPNYGEAGDQVLISGSHFGAPGAGGQVFFDVPAVAVSQAGEPVLAEVVTVDVEGTPVPQWGASSIKVLVPYDAPVNGAVVYVVANGEQSNSKEFMVLPTPYDDEAPVITIVDPPNGEIGTAINIEGDRFGHIQSGSIAELGDMNLNVVTWSNTIIQALVPAGAVTGMIRVTVNGKPSNEIDFVVANTPRIDSVSPYEIRVGNPFQVTGIFFGLDQGGGRLTIGGTAQEVGTWDDTIITVPELLPISATGEQIEVIVTADNGLSSDPAFVELVSDLDVRVSVDPTAGQRNDQAGQGGTSFAFQVSVAGGSGDYTFHLIPDAGNPSSEAPFSDTSPVTYTYPFVSGAQDEVYYDTKMRVVDTDNGDSVTVAVHPPVLVVNPGVPVITRIALSNHNRGTTPAPNDWCYSQEGAEYFFHDFTFTGGNRLFTSAIGDIMSGGNPLASYTRSELSFTSTGSSPRPYGNRYAGTAGAEVEIQGLNLGATQGTVTLGVSAASPTPIDVFASWTDQSVKFLLPAVEVALSGTVSVTPLGSAKQATSVIPLVCSPYVNSVVPDEVDIEVGSVTLSGFDFQPTVISEMVGGETYGIWMVRASYDDPFVGGNVINLVLLTTPIEPTTLVGTTMKFSMASLDVDGNGTVPVEVFNDGNDASQVVEGTLEIGGYYLFLWTGALTDGTNNELATSGVFSEAYPVEVILGTAIDNPPVPNLSVNPTSGDAPLNVTVDASGSTDDGAITKYEFDFGEGALWEDFGLTSSTDHTYAADGSYQVRVQVTDDAVPTPQSVASAPITVNVGGPGPGNTITVTLTVDFGDDGTGNPWDGANLGTLTRLIQQPGDVLVDQIFILHTNGVPDVLTFEDWADSDYDVEVNRIVTNWVGFGDIQATQTVTVPPDANVEFEGIQTADPPPPG